MAQIELLAKIILVWEGHFVNDPTDRGGATNCGVTLSTWRSQGYDKNGDGIIDVKDLMMLTKQDVINILEIYWNKWQGDKIQNQSVANILVDWVWGSGIWGIKIPQRVLNVTADGIVGKQTIAVLNDVNQEKFFNQIKIERMKFLNNIVLKNPSQERFIKGWTNRLDSFKFKEI